MVITKQNPIINTQKINIKEAKHITGENHQTTKKGSEKRRQKQNNQTIMNKMAIVSLNLSIITLIISICNSPIKT